MATTTAGQTATTIAATTGATTATAITPTITTPTATTPPSTVTAVLPATPFLTTATTQRLPTPLPANLSRLLQRAAPHD